MRLAIATVLLGSLFAVACGAAGGEDQADAGFSSGEMWLGGADPDGQGFVELVSGADAELIPGAQGGFHVWIGVRVQKAAGHLYIEHQARRQFDGALVLAGSRRVLDVPEDAMTDWWQSPFAAPSFMCPAPVGLRVVDEPLVFSSILSTEDGQVIARDELVLVPRCPVGEYAAFCAQICSG